MSLKIKCTTLIFRSPCYFDHDHHLEINNWERLRTKVHDKQDYFALPNRQLPIRKK